jgi:epoxyqueuosine reductase
VFLSQVITTLELIYDAPQTDHCGTCTLCIGACPTGAIVEPYLLDSNRCISYLTIEHKGETEGPPKKHLDQWIFGCDVCQDICPWNQKFSVTSEEEKFGPRPWNRAPHLEEWEKMSEHEFEEKFRGSPIKRAKYGGLQRNIRAVLDAQRYEKGTS